MKNRETLFVTYNQLADLLGLKENSIRKIYEKDPSEEILYIFHDDDKYAIEYSDNAQVIHKKFNNLSNLNKEIEYLTKMISSGLQVSHSSAVEYLFGYKLYEEQKKMIDSCFSNISNAHQPCWKRQSGATTCAMLEALYLSMLYGKTIVFMNNDFMAQGSLIERINCLLNEKRISYSNPSKNRIYFPYSNGTITFITPIGFNKINGINIDKIITDNLNAFTIDNCELDSYTIRFYRTMD